MSSVRLALVGSVLIVAPFCQSTQAEPGGLDPSFDYNGVVKTDIGTEGTIWRSGGTMLVGGMSNNAIASMALQSDGKIVAGGKSTHRRTLLTPTEPITLEWDDGNFALVRYLPNGSLDSTFGNNGCVVTNMGTTDDILSKVFVLPSGKILALGVCQDRIGLARYLPNGTLDSSFGDQGTAFVSLGSPSGTLLLPAALQSNGKIVIGITLSSGTAEILRLNATGTVDTSFAQQGRFAIVKTDAAISWGTVVTLNALDDDSLVAATTTSKGFSLIRLLSSGALDPTFGQNGAASLDFAARAVAVQPDGKYVFTGFAYDTASSDFLVGRLLTNGQPDPDFGDNGQISTDFNSQPDTPEAIAVQPNGTIVVAGATIPPSSSAAAFPSHSIILACYTSSGSLDSSFGTGGKVYSHLSQVPPGSPYIGEPTDAASTILLQPDGKILVGGFSDPLYLTTGPDFLLVRYLTDNSASSLPYVPEVEAEFVPVTTNDESAVAKVRPSDKPKSRTRTIHATVRNFGTRFDKFTLRGTRTSRQIRVKYLVGKRDITSLIERKKYETGLMSPEDFQELTIKIAPTRKINSKLKMWFKLTAISNGNQSSLSVAKVRVSAKSFRSSR